jgi:hypothetical protein
LRYQSLQLEWLALLVMSLKVGWEKETGAKIPHEANRHKRTHKRVHKPTGKHTHEPTGKANQQPTGKQMKQLTGMQTKQPTGRQMS